MNSLAGRCTVVICAYLDHRRTQLASAVESVLAQNPPPGELLVVVDHNPDLLARTVAEFDGRCRVLPSEQRQGLSGARNTGLLQSVGDFVVFLDDDARAEAGWLEALLAPFSDPGVVGVGGLTIPEWEEGASPRWMPDEFLWVVGCHYRGHRTTAGPIRSPIGANMAFRRSEVMEAGGFSTEFASPPLRLSCEETELAIRLSHLTGGSIAFAPGAVALHSVPAERRRWSYFARRCLREGRTKAILSTRAGFGPATGPERAYVVDTLLPGMGHRVRKAIAEGDPSQWAQAASIAAGLGLTALGYAHGSLRALSTPSRLPARRHPDRPEGLSQPTINDPPLQKN